MAVLTECLCLLVLSRHSLRHLCRLWGERQFERHVWGPGPFLQLRGSFPVSYRPVFASCLSPAYLVVFAGSVRDGTAEQGGDRGRKSAARRRPRRACFPPRHGPGERHSEEAGYCHQREVGSWRGKTRKAAKACRAFGCFRRECGVGPAAGGYPHIEYRARSRRCFFLAAAAEWRGSGHC